MRPHSLCCVYNYYDIYILYIIRLSVINTAKSKYTACTHTHSSLQQNKQKKLFFFLNFNFLFFLKCVYCCVYTLSLLCVYKCFDNNMIFFIKKKIKNENKNYAYCTIIAHQQQRTQSREREAPPRAAGYYYYGHNSRVYYLILFLNETFIYFTEQILAPSNTSAAHGLLPYHQSTCNVHPQRNLVGHARLERSIITENGNARYLMIIESSIY